MISLRTLLPWRFSSLLMSVANKVADTPDLVDVLPQVKSRSQTRVKVTDAPLRQPEAVEYRYERKFLVSNLNKPDIEALIRLHPAAFSEIYYERTINNVYFDSSALDSYFAAVDGELNRTKCRIRWYGDLFGFIEKPVLELKIKKGLVGTKKSYRLQPFTFEKGFQARFLFDVLKKSSLPDALLLGMQTLQPILVNRYSRKYFQSADRNYRITLDTNLEYYRIDAHNPDFLYRSLDRTHIVVELKYGQEWAKDAHKISNAFPFRMTKNSKFTNGIQALYLFKG